MKKFLRYSWLMVLPMVAAAAIVWKSSAASIGECPSILPLDYTVLLADDADCAAFHACYTNEKVLYYCPDGLLFNNELDVCDWPQYVDTRHCDQTPLPKYTCATSITQEEGTFTFFCGTCDWIGNSKPAESTTWSTCYM